MNGAQALIRTLTGCGVDVCFSNPGTSEMHFVAALDAVPQMRGVLCLFEGTATGAADGYGRMTGQPAAALLHLGPGLANGLANLHNARRACTPLLAVVGDHATYHKQFDAPLESDIDALAGSVSAWVQRPGRSADVAASAAEAVAAAMTPPGGVATLILPADVSWSGGAVPVPALPVPVQVPVPDDVVDSAAAALRSGEPCVILLGGEGMRRPGLEAASRVAQATGARMMGETFPSRHERGAGLPAIDRVAYLAEFAVAQLGDVRHLILAGARAPVSFFAYPGKPSYLVPEGCRVHLLAEAGNDVCGALAALADLVAPGTKPLPQQPERPALPDGNLTAASSRSKQTAAPCTRSPPCGPTPGKGSTSPRSSSATGRMRSSAWNWIASARRRQVKLPGACLSCPGPASISPPWRVAWASRPAGQARRRSSRGSSGVRWRSPGRTSSRPRSPRSASPEPGS